MESLLLVDGSFLFNTSSRPGLMPWGPEAAVAGTAPGADAGVQLSDGLPLAKVFFDRWAASNSERQQTNSCTGQWGPSAPPQAVYWCTSSSARTSILYLYAMAIYILIAVDQEVLGVSGVCACGYFRSF